MHQIYFKLNVQLFLILWTVVTLEFTASDNAQEYKDHVVLQFRPKSVEEGHLLRENLLRITEGKADFWTEVIAPNSAVDVMVDKKFVPEIEKFAKMHNLEGPKVIVDDLVSTEEEVTGRTLTNETELDFFFKKYLKLEEIDHFICILASKYPHLVTILPPIGESNQKEPLKVVKISANNRTKQIIWIDSLIHAREWITLSSTLYWMRTFVSNYGVNETITQIMDNFDFYFLPVVNPDGYEYSRTTSRFWRKNLGKFDDSACLGVDLNRNFDSHFVQYNDPCHLNYPGKGPNSQPEVKAIVDFLLPLKGQVEVYISVHSYGQWILIPWAWKTGQVANFSNLKWRASLATSSIKVVSGKKYGVEQAANIYIANGVSMDWAYEKLETPYAYTFELRPSDQDNLKHQGFVLPTDQIVPAGKEFSAAIVSLTRGLFDPNYHPVHECVGTH